MRSQTSVEKTELKIKDEISVENKCISEEDIFIKCELDEMVQRFFKDFIIVWHDKNVDSEENKRYIARLAKFCKVETFTEWEQASKFIQGTKEVCHVITSGTNGELLVKEINSSQNALAIYIFCLDKDYHFAWAKNYEKVSCVEAQIENILDDIEQNLLEWYQKESSLKTNLPAFAPVFNDFVNSQSYTFHCYLKIIPNFKNRSQAKNDTLALSRRIYSDKMNKSFMVDFEKNYNEYKKEAILTWYTQESFLFKVTNNGLRIATSDSIQYCRLILKDLEQAIKEQYREKSRHFCGLLYRAASLSETEWLILKANLNREIEMYGFLSTSKDKDQVLKFMQLDPSKNVFITILVPKCLNDEHDEEQGFAEVEEFSLFPHELEVLFNFKSRFTILEVEDKYSEDLPYRHLVLLYGAQSFQKYVTEKNPVEEILIPNVENISCSLCHGKFSQNMLFTPVHREEIEKYLCKKCLPDFWKAHNSPLFCIPVVDKNQQMKKVKVQGVLMNFTMKEEIRMYGYKCCKCQAKKREIYYKCTVCSRERNTFCENCIDSATICLKSEHPIVLESSPFSFWCHKMFQTQNYFVFRDGILACNLTLQQGWMYVENHVYERAIELYKVYIFQNGDKEKEINLALVYCNLAFVHENQAECKNALENYSLARESLKLLSEDNHPHVKNCSKSLGQVGFKRMLEYCSKALDIVKSLDEDDSTEVATCCRETENLDESQAEYKKALEYHSKALKIFKSIYGDHHPSVATSYSNMGNVSENQLKYQEALEYYSKALKIGISVFGENHSEVALCYCKIGEIYNCLKEYQEALEYHTEALNIYKSLHDHPNVAISYINLGQVYGNQGEYLKALESYSEALEVHKSLYGGHHSHLAIFYSNMGQVYRNLAQYQKALEFHSKALEIYKLIYGDNHPSVAISESNMGDVSTSKTEYKNALEHYFRALEINKSFYGDNDMSVAISYHKIGSAYENQADYQKALEYYSKAREIRESVSGDNHSHVPISECSLTQVSDSHTEYKKALGFYLKALEIYKLFDGDNHNSAANRVHNIEQVSCSQTGFQKVLEYHSKAMEIYRLLFEDIHQNMTACSYNLGQVYSNVEINKAIEYKSTAREAYKSSYRNNHPYVAACFLNLIAVYENQAEYKKTLDYYSNAAEMDKSLSRNNLSKVGKNSQEKGQVEDWPIPIHLSD